MAHNIVAQEEIDSRNERSIVVAGEFQTNSYLGIIAGSNTIFDYDLEKYQDDINKETKESIELLQADNISKGNCTLPFDEFTNNAIILESTTGGTPATYTDNLQLAQVFTGKIVYTTVSKSFYLKHNNKYYSFWNVTRDGTYTLSSSDWYKDYQGKLFYNRSTKVLYAYDYDARKISPITDIKVVQTTPNSETTPIDTPKGSLIYVEGTGKTYMWNGSYWSLQGGGNDNIQGQNISLLNNDSGYVTQEDIPSILSIRDNKLYLEKPVEGGENVIISLVAIPIGGESSYNLASYNKELGQTVPSDIALSNDNKLVLRDRTTADGGKNIVTLRENPVTGRVHKCTVVVHRGLVSPLTAIADNGEQANRVYITIDGTTYNITISNWAQLINGENQNNTIVPIDAEDDTLNKINNRYPEPKYVAKHIADNFLSNIYNMTTKKIRVPYIAEYISEENLEKIVFTRCSLLKDDETVSTSSITFTEYTPNAGDLTGTLFTISDNNPNDEVKTVNVLTLDMITPSNTNRENTIFKVLIDYDLLGQEIDIPEGCILLIDGGSITNGYLRGNNTMCTDFSAISAELIGTWRNNDNEVVDNGIRRAKKRDVKIGSYFYVGGQGWTGCMKVGVYRNLKKIGMDDVNMVIVYAPTGLYSIENRGMIFLPYQSTSNQTLSKIDSQGRNNKWKLTHYTEKVGGVTETFAKIEETAAIKHPLTASISYSGYLGLEENYEDNGEIKTRPVQLIPDTVTVIPAGTQNPNGKTYPYDTYYVNWGNADLVGLGIMLRLGIDNLSFVKFVEYAKDNESSYFVKPDNFTPVDPNKLTSSEEATVASLVYDSNADGNETIEKVKNHARFIKKYIERLEGFGFKFTDVYVANECSLTTDVLYGSSERNDAITNAVKEDLIDVIKSEGYRIGITFSQLFGYVKAKPEIFNALDEAGLNHYPSLSYKDEMLTDEDDFSDYNIIAIKNAMNGDFRKKKMPLYITEGGCDSFKGALRGAASHRNKVYYNLNGNPELELDHSVSGHVFYKSLFKAADVLGAKKVNVWHPETLIKSDVKDIIIDCFYK